MQDFESKRKALFACLDDASNELKGTSLEQNIVAQPFSGIDDTEMVYRDGSGQRNNVSDTARSGLKRLRGKESLFKKPELPIARCLKPKKLPDYQINPHKWKKYSLEDVDISDHTNTAAALDFLRTIDSQKEETESRGNDDDDDSLGHTHGKIEFKKSSKIRRTMKSIESQEQQDADVDSPKLKGSKLVMPEYVVGVQAPKSTKKQNANASPKKKQRAAGHLTLTHLQEEDDDAEDE